MVSKRQNVLEILKSELKFLEGGGYRDPDRWTPAFIFEDSAVCMHPDRSRPAPCAECPLIQFVPTALRREPAPCRHIALNAQGYTLDRMYRWNTRDEIEAAVHEWLKMTIARLEAERAKGAGAE